MFDYEYDGIYRRDLDAYKGSIRLRKESRSEALRASIRNFFRLRSALGAVALLTPVIKFA